MTEVRLPAADRWSAGAFPIPASCSSAASDTKGLVLSRRPGRARENRGRPWFLRSPVYTELRALVHPSCQAAKTLHTYTVALLDLCAAPPDSAPS